MSSRKEKIKSLKEITKIAKAARQAKKKVVTTNGCFDIVHVGHVRNLKAAKALGDILIVGINSDASVKKNKGSKRPIIPANERAEMLASLESVDYIFIFSAKSPLNCIKKIKPDVHVKGRGSEHLPAFALEKSTIEKMGTKMILVPFALGRSTTAIIETITKRYS